MVTRRRTKGITSINVSDVEVVNSRGKRVNNEIPDEERRRVSTKKSNSRKALLRRKKVDQERKDAEALDNNKEIGTVKKRRRKKVAEEPSPTRKKKRRRKTTGELLKAGKTKQAQRRIGRVCNKAESITKDLDVIDAEIQEDMGELMLMPAEMTTEADFLKEYQHIYVTMGSIIRKLEERMQDPDSKYGVSSKDVYALMTMYSQMRETIADMRSIKDMQSQAEEIATYVFDPAVKSAGESLVNLYFKMTTSIRKTVKDTVIVETLLEGLKQDVANEASELQEQFLLSRSKILEVLSGV